MRLDDLKPVQNIIGIEPSEIVTLIAVTSNAKGTAQIIFKNFSDSPEKRPLITP